MQTSALSASSAGSSSTSAMLNSISSDDFLTLLVTELQMQDPLNPMDTEGMVQQLSQMEMVAETRLVREGQEFAQSQTLIGKPVHWQDGDTGAYCNGTVEGVLRDDGSVLLVVGDNRLKLDDVLAIS